MSAALQEWMLEHISNFELEKWLYDDNAIETDLPLKCEVPSEIHSNIEDVWMKENDYWLEEIPLFEEIQPLEELKIQSLQGNKEVSQDKLFNNAIATPEVQPHISQPQDLFTTSMENTTLFFTNDVLYIKTDPNVDFSFLHQEKEKSTPYLSSPPSGNVEETRESRASNESVEVETVDEIIRNTAMELDQWESDTSRSEASSGSGGTSDTSASMAPEEEESGNDPEWTPPRVFKSSSSRKGGRASKATRGSGGALSKTKSQEDKANRKKEQNKNAATRYRQKKKAEIHKILREEEELKKAKVKLTEKVFDIESEIKCLKGLMRELFKAKGLI